MQPKKIAAIAAFQSFATNILLFSCCQLFKALQPTSCFSVVISYSKLCNQHLAFQLLSAIQSFATNILL